MLFIAFATAVMSGTYFILFSISDANYILKNGESDPKRKVLALTFLLVAFISAGSILMNFDALILFLGSFVFIFMFFISVYQAFFLFDKSSANALIAAANAGLSIGMMHRIFDAVMKFYS